MYDWLTSKVAMSMAAAILIVVVLGFVYEQNRSYNTVGFQNIADEMANACNKVASSSCNLTHVITSKKGMPNSTYVSPTSGGTKYKVVVWRDAFEVRQAGVSARARISTVAHLWAPGGLYQTNTTRLKDADSRIDNDFQLQFDSGNELVIEQRLILVGGLHSYTTFIYLKSTPVDEDSDGLPTWWEITNCLDKSANDASNDADADGLTNAEEYAARTDPTVNDTDKDGLFDSYEVKTLGTDPTNYDTDSDGLGDGEEIVPGEDGFVTDPKNADTDNDGCPDGMEFYYSTDPTQASSHP